MELTQNKSIFALFGQFYVELEVSPEAWMSFLGENI
jgi:hypothetical protein